MKREVIEDVNHAVHPKVFSPLYVMYRKPSSSLWSSYTSDISAAA